MANPLLVGVGAGLAAAVLFASGTTGGLGTRLLLNLLTPLPLFLVGLGWGVPAGGIAAIVGTLLIALLTRFHFALAFALQHALPAVLLCYLVLLNRPAPPLPQVPTASVPTSAPASRGPQVTEWFPIGTVVALATVLAGLFSVWIIRLMGGDAASMAANLRTLLTPVIEQMQRVATQPLTEEQISQLVEFGAYALPAGTALSWLMGTLLNLYLAGRITLASGRLARPWPDLSALRYPKLFPFGFALVLLLSYLPDPAPLLASGFGGAFMVAYLLLGLAIAHAIARASRHKHLVLAGAYAFVLLLPQVGPLIVALVGLADPFMRFRERWAVPPPGAGPAPRPPPSPPTS